MEEDLSKAERLKELTILTAPSDAVVLDIANYNPGTVIKSGETMMTLVPLNEPLEAAVYIDPSDIGYIRQATRPKSSSIPTLPKIRVSRRLVAHHRRGRPGPRHDTTAAGSSTRGACASPAWTI